MSAICKDDIVTGTERGMSDVPSDESRSANQYDAHAREFVIVRRRASQNFSKAATRSGGVSILLCINKLTDAQRQRVLHLFRDGLSFRAIERATGHRRETISRYVKQHRFEKSVRSCRARRTRDGWSHSVRMQLSCNA